MKVVTFAGAHACGKTAVIMKAVQDLKEQGIHAAVMKLDCISSEDDKIYERAGIPTVKYLSGNTCPDHFFVQSIEQAYAWARERRALWQMLAAYPGYSGGLRDRLSVRNLRTV